MLILTHSVLRQPHRMLWCCRTEFGGGTKAQAGKESEGSGRVHHELPLPLSPLQEPTEAPSTPRQGFPPLLARTGCGEV